MATMTSGLGGALGYGENSFKTNGADYASFGPYDDSAVQVDITSAFGPSGINFFGTYYTDIWINSNGLITFDGHNTSYSPTGIAGLDEPAIAPFWTDIDIDKGGDIYWDIDPSAGTVTITWLDVHAYSGSSTDNSFQVVLTDTGNGNFDVEFIYEEINWTTGGAGHAEVGITDGGLNDYELEGSGDQAVLLTYPTNDFDNGNPAGTYELSVENGVPIIGAIDGTAGADLIDLSFVDSDGDMLSTDDDFVLAGDGADTIANSEGADIVYGEGGDDIIYTSGGGSGPPITWTDVSNGDNLTGSGSADYYRWTPSGSGHAATIRFNNSASAGDGDGVADYLLVTNTNDSGRVTIGDFDVGTDKIVLQENWAGVSFSNAGSYIDFSITYANGNQQSFRLYNDNGGASSSEVFTLDEPGSAAIADDDSLFGGDGADRFLVADHFGNDTIEGGEGATDSDEIDADALTGAITVTYSGDEAGTFTDGADTIAFSEIERLALTAQNDSVDGSADSAGMLIQAHGGDDSVTGGSGADTLDGGGGNDSLTGGAGNDLVASWNGAASMDGGDGADTFRLFNSAGGGGFDGVSIIGGEGGTDADTVEF